MAHVLGEEIRRGLGARCCELTCEHKAGPGVSWTCQARQYIPKLPQGRANKSCSYDRMRVNRQPHKIPHLLWEQGFFCQDLMILYYNTSVDSRMSLPAGFFYLTYSKLSPNNFCHKLQVFPCNHWGLRSVWSSIYGHCTLTRMQATSPPETQDR